MAQKVNGISVSDTPKIGERPYPSPFHPVEIRGESGQNHPKSGRYTCLRASKPTHSNTPTNPKYALKSKPPGPEVVLRQRYSNLGSHTYRWSIRIPVYQQLCVRVKYVIISSNHLLSRRVYLPSCYHRTRNPGPHSHSSARSTYLITSRNAPSRRVMGYNPDRPAIYLTSPCSAKQRRQKTQRTPIYPRHPNYTTPTPNFPISRDFPTFRPNFERDFCI